MVLNNLFPRHEPKGTIVINELDEFGEVTFVCKGKVGIGYEINKVKKYCIVLENRCIIGGYGATFGQRSAFVYCALTDLDGYFIRRNNWIQMLDEFPDVGFVLKRNILYHYFSHIRFKLAAKKKKDVMKYMKRKDY